MQGNRNERCRLGSRDSNAIVTFRSEAPGVTALFYRLFLKASDSL
jgi:hypothetical protein